MSSNKLLYSIGAVTLALALSSCGKKQDVKTEASQPDDTFAMKEVTTATPTAADGTTPAQAPQSDDNTGVAASATAGAKGNVGGATAAQNVQQSPGATIEQGAALQQTPQASSANLSKKTPSKVRLRNGHEAANDAQ